MNYSRFAGFMWGVPFGVCIAAGIFVDARMFILAILPLAGNYFHRHVGR